jgi:hypothetical protein
MLVEATGPPMTVEFRQIGIADTNAFRAAVEVVPRERKYIALVEAPPMRMAILIDGTYHDEIIMARSKD